MGNNSNCKSRNRNYKKLGSILLVVMFITSSFLIIMSSNLEITTAGDAPTTTDRADNDFVNGTMENLRIIDSGSEVELILQTYNSSTWIKKYPAINPEGRFEHDLAFIYGTNMILLHGGQDSSSVYRNDTWIYNINNNTWIEKNPINYPKYKSQHAMASIWGDDKVVLFGGGGGYNNDTWIYDLSDNNWTEKNTINQPLRRGYHKMATFNGTKKALMFGGIYSLSFNDTWIYDLNNNTWTEMKPKNSPKARYQHAMAAIPDTDKILLFGGIDDGMNYFGDTWIYDLSDNNWAQIIPPNSPQPRSPYTMAPIFGTDKILLFDGPHLPRNNDTWVFDFSETNWIKLQPMTSPSGRQAHVMAPVYGTDKILLFGGSTSYLNDTWIFSLYQYLENGTYVSNPFDIGPKSSLKTISWNASTTNITSIKFQLRSADTELELNSKVFIGFDGTPTSYYISSPSNIWFGHINESWVQYKAYLFTNNKNETPRLKNVTITYNYWPNTTLVDPNNGSIKVDNKPYFEWNFTDRDSIFQEAFQVLIDDESEFESLNYNSGEQYANTSTWQFPNGTTYAGLPDGIWYWKVRTKDNDGDWGSYSKPWRFTIDTKAPGSIIAIPINDGFYNNLNSISGIAYEATNSSGIDKVEITIKDLYKNRFWNGYGWALEENWLSTNGTKEWLYNSSSITWASGSLYHVQSRATDNATNIETPSVGKIFTFDMDNVVFSNPKPLVNDVSPKQKVEVGITISDSISGVNASTIKYAVSEDSGNTWGSWVSVEGLNNQMDINVNLNLTFPNGTENRIKWSALDIVGNGPTESMIYPINVNIWREKIITPKVRLWNPKNGSIIHTTYVELSWMLENWNLRNVIYDIYLDTVDPPVAINRSDVINTSLIVNDLIDGTTYYWMVIPRIGNNSGSCISGVWSFTLDVPIPSVKLILPVKGSEVQALRPTLVWTVNYNGTEDLTYDIYLGKNNSIEIEILDYYDTNYLSKNVLENNETYYWKVVPKAGGISGKESEIWWFTVRSKEKVSIPRFEFELKLDPPEIELKPGEIRYVKAIVSNLGELNDKIVLSIPERTVLSLDVEINQPKIIELSPNGTAEFNITVKAQEDALEDEISIIVVAASTNAAGYNQVVEKRATLTVKILAEGKHDAGKSTDASWYWIILLIIFVIIIVLFFVGLILKRKKQPEQEPLPTQANTAEPKIEVSQLPEKVPGVVTAAPTKIPIVHTTVADSTPPIQATPTPTPIPGQTPQPQILKAPEQPLLPPAKIEETKPNEDDDNNESVTKSTNTDVTPQPETEPKFAQAPNHPPSTLVHLSDTTLTPTSQAMPSSQEPQNVDDESKV